MSILNIFYGSVFGNAQNVAEKLQMHLSEKGVECKVVDEPSVQALVDAKSIVVVSSTCGLGDVPPNLDELVNDSRDQGLNLNAKPFAVAALGDSSYADTFCGGGKKVFELLEELQGAAVSPLLEVDAIETFEPDLDVISWIDTLIDELVA